jgi:hypothetical protein
MARNQRFIASIVKTAKAETPSLPFQRGARRAAFIAKREGHDVEPLKKSA